MLSLNMATVTVRQLDEETKALLRIRAAQHGHSMEQEARDILQAALAPPPPDHWLDQINRIFGNENGVEPEELLIPPRELGPLTRVNFDE